MPPLVTAPCTKSMPLFELKAVDEAQGIFEGYLSVFGNIDSYKDIVEPGAFSKTINDARGKGGKYLFPLLWQHDPRDPIGGFLDMTEDRKGLFVRAQIDMSTSNGQRAYSGLKMGYLDGLSIGYDTIKHKFVGDIRHLQEVRMWEGSVVTFPANNDTRVNNVKCATGSTNLPLASRDMTWDGAKAQKQIVLWATKEDDTLDHDKMKSAHFYIGIENPDTVGDYKLPFCYITNGKPTAIPKGIMAAAAAVSGARGGVDLGDAVDGVKSKIATYYHKMAAEFKDKTIIAPWEKSAEPDTERKGFAEHFQEASVADWLEDWHDMTHSLRASILDAFLIGDQPKVDTQMALTGKDGFTTEVMKWVDEGITLEVADFLDFQQDQTVPMLRLADTRERELKEQIEQLGRSIREQKAGRIFSNSNRGKINLSLDAIRDAIKQLQTLLDDTNIYDPGDDNPEPEPKTGPEVTGEPAGEGSAIGPIVPVKSEEPPTIDPPQDAQPIEGEEDTRQEATSEENQIEEEELLSEMAMFSLLKQIRNHVATK